MSRDPAVVALRPEGDGWVVSLPPRLEAAVEDSLAPAVERALASSPRLLVLDFSSVTFADSAGIGTIVDALRRAGSRKVAVALACLGGQPKLVLERIGLTRFAPSFATVEEALAGDVSR